MCPTDLQMGYGLLFLLSNADSDESGSERSEMPGVFWTKVYCTSRSFCLCRSLVPLSTLVRAVCPWKYLPVISTSDEMNGVGPSRLA